MDEPTKTDQFDQLPGDLPLKKVMPPWHRPALIFLGKLGDLVQGQGKSGEGIDSDKNGGTKPPGQG